VKNFAQNDVTQMLTYTAPSFQSARQTISDGTDHIDPAGLRGLGPDQTLVLMNGKRRHNTALVNINGTIGRGSVGTDLNAIPAAAIERIEVLRDGAAAQYGSDAIAGVINVVLKKYKGFNISAMAGQNTTNMPYNGDNHINDGLNTQVDFTAGLIGKKKGYLTLSGQWLKRERSNRSGNDNIPLLYYGNGGAFPPTQAGVDPATYRKWLIDLDKSYSNQRSYDRHNIYAGNSESENKSLFLNAGLPIGKVAEFYVAGGIGSRDGFATGFSRNPNSVSQQPVTTNNQRYYFDGFLPEIHTKITDGSILGGVRFDLEDWNIDVSETYGKNSIGFNIENTGNASLPAAATVQTKFDAGKLEFEQSTLNADLSRRFNLGDKKSFNLGFGGEFRREFFGIGEGELNSYTNGGRIAKVDPIPPYPGTSTPVTLPDVVPGSGSQVFPGFQPGDAINADRTIYAAYVDGELTMDKLLLGAAVRFENYRESDTLSYSGTGAKITARYELTENFAIRGSVNTGFRAPSLHQRYFQNTSTQFVAGVPSNSLTANNENPIVKNAFGIQELKPEKSKSATIGVVGKFGDNITFTVDGYFIRIDDRIVLSTPFNRSNPFVNEILNAYRVDASVSAVQFWTNAINTETKGVDFVVTDRFKLG
jgi:iron complex outermembrane receptor protein